MAARYVVPVSLALGMLAGQAQAASALAEVVQSNVQLVLMASRVGKPAPGFAAEALAQDNLSVKQEVELIEGRNAPTIRPRPWMPAGRRTKPTSSA